MIMMFCWESNQIQAAVLDSTIPQDSIRIRILANSDSPQDQWIKRQVQLEVVKEIGSWVLDPTSLDEARAAIRGNIPALEQAVGSVLAANGYADEDYHVELGQVPFPAKQFGNKVYPAGTYEALRIVLGSGQGQNWWCVLFPPLCFVGVKAKAAPAPTPAPAAEPSVKDTKAGKDSKETKATNGSKEAQASNDPKAAPTVKPAGKADSAANVGEKGEAVQAGASEEGAPKAEVKFFVWEIGKKIGHKIGHVVKSLFA